MILEHLSEDVTLESLMKSVKGLEIDLPQQDDYDPGLWPEMQSRKFISTIEKIKGRDGLWQLSFDNSGLYFIQFNIEYGIKSEKAFNNCVDVCRTIFKINNSVRGMKEFLTSTEFKRYQEFKEETMPYTGFPDERYVQFAFYSWRSRIKSAYLSASLIWPDSMSVEYREEPVRLQHKNKN